MRFGVNYVPSEKWWYCWGDYSRKEIERDFEAIASLGMDHVRIFFIWPYFQPNPDFISESCLKRAEEMLDIADRFKLDVNIAVLTSFLSGFGFLPSWHKGRNMFCDPQMIKAERLLFKTVAQRLAGHPRFLGFDLGNELNVMGAYGNPFTISQANKWQTEMLEYCEELAPGKMHVNGVGQMPWFKNISFSREVLANTGSATALHAYIFFTDAISHYKPMETGCLHLLEYMIELSKAYSEDINRKIWFQETGITDCWMEKELMPDFAEASIRNAMSCENLWGITWWCSHDIDSKYGEFHDLEYELGLLDCNNRIKPVGERIAKLIRETEKSPCEIVQRSTAIVIDDEKFSDDVTRPPFWEFGKRFMDCIDSGIRPSIVLKTRTDDKEYLNSRKITRLLF